MASRRSYKDRYQNLRAQLGEDEHGGITDQQAIAKARQTMLDYDEGLIDDEKVVERARKLLEQCDRQQEMVFKARKTVERFAQDSDDAEELKLALGIHPSQELLNPSLTFAGDSAMHASALKGGAQNPAKRSA
jgi:hypothetical protein